MRNMDDASDVDDAFVFDNDNDDDLGVPSWATRVEEDNIQVEEQLYEEVFLSRTSKSSR